MFASASRRRPVAPAASLTAPPGGAVDVVQMDAVAKGIGAAAPENDLIDPGTASGGVNGGRHRAAEPGGPRAVVGRRRDDCHRSPLLGRDRSILPVRIRVGRLEWWAAGGVWQPPGSGLLERRRPVRSGRRLDVSDPDTFPKAVAGARTGGHPDRRVRDPVHHAALVRPGRSGEVHVVEVNRPPEQLGQHTGRTVAGGRPPYDLFGRHRPVERAVALSHRVVPRPENVTVVVVERTGGRWWAGRQVFQPAEHRGAVEV